MRFGHIEKNTSYIPKSHQTPVLSVGIKAWFGHIEKKHSAIPKSEGFFGHSSIFFFYMPKKSFALHISDIFWA